jgi:hypothetical protein
MDIQLRSNGFAGRMLNVNKCLLACGLGLLCAMIESACAADGPHVGPLFDDFPLTLSTGHRTEVLGPLFYWEEKGSQNTWAIPPLFSQHRDPATDSEDYDFCYPLLTYDRFGKEHRWQFFQLLSFAGGQNQREDTSHRFTL